MTAIDIRTQLHQLRAERAQAALAPLASPPTYLADLDEEIAAVRHAYAGTVVTEIATLRAELFGAQVG